GLSALLPRDKAEEEKYQAMNMLVVQGITLVCETWSKAPPKLLVLVNVPRITTRGAPLLVLVKNILRAYGYAFHETPSYDLRLVGNLGAERRRYLLVARHEKQLAQYVFRPPLHQG